MLDQDTFLNLLREHEGRLYRIALAITGQEADAWDALQDTVEAAIRHRGQLVGGPAAFPAWIRRILVNRSLNLLRARGRVVPVDPAMQAEPADPLPPPEQSLAARQIWTVVQELDPGQRQVVALRFLADLPLEEVAEQLRLPLGTVKSRLHRALARLRSLLQEQERRSAP